MAKLYNIQLVDFFDRGILEQELHVFDSLSEAKDYAEAEWEQQLDECQLEICIMAVDSVDGYKIQLVKEEE